MEHESDLAKRTAAFQTLLRDVGEQLGRQNTDDIEFFESVPQDERGKGGIKLLEYLRNRGRFTQWRIEPLREILRRCNRCDLADNLVKKYQLNFSDRDSPQATRPLTDHVHVASNSPLLSSSSHRRSRSSPISWLADVENHPTTLTSSNALPQQEMATASSHCISGSLPNDCRGFTTSSSPSHLRQRSADHQSPVQEGLLSAASLSRLDYFGKSNSISSLHSIHMHPHQNCCSNNRYELANTAIRAMLEIVTHTNRTPSCTSIHSDNSFDYHHTRTLSDEGKLRPITAKGEPDENKTPILARRTSDLPQSSPPPNGRSSSDSRQATGCVLGSNATPPSPPPTTEGPDCNSDQETVTKASPQRVGLLRPVSGYRKQPLDNFRWLVKQERLLKSVLRPQETKFQTIVCSRRLELEVGEGKYNPKLSLILYPNGLFINKGKSASLQAKIVTPDKCPPLPPSLLVQLNVTVYGNDGQEKWKETSTQETINTYSFYIHNLFTCQTVREDCNGDYIHLSISVQIQKATEQ